MRPTDGRTTQVFAQANQASGDGNRHTGQDFAGNRGAEVRTISDGVVIHAGSTYSNALADRLMLVRGSGNSGRFVVVEHDGWLELFAHLDSINVVNGQRVTRGQRVGGVGDSGLAFGTHLHYETIDPRLIRNTFPYGRYNPELQIAQEDREAAQREANKPVHTAPAPVPGGKILTVTAPVVMVRTSPWVRNDNIAPAYPNGIAKGAQIVAIGYTQGQDPYPQDGVQDDAWIKTKSGYFIWANGVGNDISGLPRV